MTKSFLIVFHGQIVNGKIIDIGDDPCFDSPPSWGICRPPTRRTVQRGDTLIFIAKVDNNYFLKGWFQVGDKLDYVSALKRFPSRQNVIISSTASTKAIRWRYKKLENIYATTHGQTIPNFLLDLQSADGLFYQSQVDEHEVDNWKCRRIFHCRSKQFEKCISTNSCFKNGSALKTDEYKNYVVADPNHWADLDNLKITFDEIAKATNFPKPIRTPKGQHNVLRFDDFKEKLFALIDSKINSSKN
jgi:hypothetical protein